MFTVLQYCTAHGSYLAPANYGESFNTYYKARKFSKSINFLFGVVRSDRVEAVCRAYKQSHN